MSGNTDDKRVRRTKRLLREALLHLMEREPVGRISTTRLCAEADINRNTFYAHYSSPEDVLQELEDELIAEVMSLAPTSLADRESSIRVYRHYAENQDTYRTLMRSPSSMILRCEVDALLKRNISWQNDADEKRLARGRLFLRFVAMGSLAIIEDWIEDGCSMSPEELFEITDQFSRHGLDGFAHE